MIDIDIPEAALAAAVAQDAPISPPIGGLQFKDVSPMICGVVDNGVCQDDPRVMVRLNEATKIAMDHLVPVGGMCIANVAAVGTVLALPPQMENAITVRAIGGAQAYGQKDIVMGWYEIVDGSIYIDPASHHDNPLVDRGLFPDATNPAILRRTYIYPGLTPPDAIVQVVGCKRFLPITNEEDFLIVQNIEALKCLIISIERYENNAIDDAQKYRQTGLEMLQAEVKKYMLDPVHNSLRKSFYRNDLTVFSVNTLGYVRAQIALDLPEALRMGKFDLTWHIQQAERRLMERGLWKDCIITIQAPVVGGVIYFPGSVQTVLAIDICGRPIPIRSQFFQFLDNGPGGAPCSNMLIDQGDRKQPGFHAPRRKYKLIADCVNGTTITAVCKLRWLLKQPEDTMTIKNYEAIRLMITAKFLEEKEDWQNATVNQQLAVDILERELRAYLGGIRHTVHIQTEGFGLGDVGNYWSK